MFNGRSLTPGWDWRPQYDEMNKLLFEAVNAVEDWPKVNLLEEQ